MNRLLQSGAWPHCQSTVGRKGSKDRTSANARARVQAPCRNSKKLHDFTSNLTLQQEASRLVHERSMMVHVLLTARCGLVGVMTSRRLLQRSRRITTSTSRTSTRPVNLHIPVTATESNSTVATSRPRSRQQKRSPMVFMPHRPNSSKISSTNKIKQRRLLLSLPRLLLLLLCRIWPGRCWQSSWWS